MFNGNIKTIIILHLLKAIKNGYLCMLVVSATNFIDAFPVNFLYLQVYIANFFSGTLNCCSIKLYKHFKHPGEAYLTFTSSVYHEVSLEIYFGW